MTTEQSDYQTRVLNAIHQQEAAYPPLSEARAAGTGRSDRRGDSSGPGQFAEPSEPTVNTRETQRNAANARRQGRLEGEAMMGHWQEDTSRPMPRPQYPAPYYVGARPGSPMEDGRADVGPGYSPMLRHGHRPSPTEEAYPGGLYMGPHPGSNWSDAMAGLEPVSHPPRRTQQRVLAGDAMTDRRQAAGQPLAQRGPLGTEEDSHSERDAGSLLDRSRARRGPRGNAKLPPFTGREPWKVWFNRFSDVADRLGWGDEDRLDELLPRIQGDAGEFVYAQLPREVRRDFSKLTAELDARYRKVETVRTFGVKFSNRDQKPGESVEEYAADLKRLYDKAYPQRPAQTRQEDLLRRFLDGLADEQARFQVEFVKEPTEIDTAVYEVVAFQETRRKPRASDPGDRRTRSYVRAARTEDSQDGMNIEDDPPPDDATHEELAPGDDSARAEKCH